MASRTTVQLRVLQLKELNRSSNEYAAPRILLECSRAARLRIRDAMRRTVVMAMQQVCTVISLCVLERIAVCVGDRRQHYNPIIRADRMHDRGSTVVGRSSRRARSKLPPTKDASNKCCLGGQA
jgi:hypothetical protein